MLFYDYIYKNGEMKKVEMCGVNGKLKELMSGYYASKGEKRWRRVLDGGTIVSRWSEVGF